ncbi:MAG: hypothetical protein IH604_09025 [Burkholderiales bacterium]|nr:hypothetical protein [Burkholderiales bacterium]
MTQTEKHTPAYAAYFVPDRENPFWTRIGAAWKHKDGDGFTLQLDLMPASAGRIVLRAAGAKPEPEAGA